MVIRISAGADKVKEKEPLPKKKDMVTWDVALAYPKDKLTKLQEVEASDNPGAEKPSFIDVDDDDEDMEADQGSKRRKSMPSPPGHIMTTSRSSTASTTIATAAHEIQSGVSSLPETSMTQALQTRLTTTRAWRPLRLKQ